MMEKKKKKITKETAKLCTSLSYILPFEELFLLNQEQGGRKKQQLKMEKSLRGEQRNCGKWRGRVRVGQGHIRMTVNVCARVCVSVYV